MFPSYDVGNIKSYSVHKMLTNKSDREAGWGV